MPVKKTFLRAWNYLRWHGLRSTIERSWREIKNKVLHDRDVLFMRDLLRGESEDNPLPENCRIKRFNEESGMPDKLFDRIADQYPEELLKEYHKKRFRKGAILWCIEMDKKDVGYTWTLAGRTIKSHFFPLTKRDIHFFDSFILPSYRGRRLNSVMKEHILKHYKYAGFHRAFSETKEWNTSSMRSLAKNGFVRIGLAKRRFRRGKCEVTWWT